MTDGKSHVDYPGSSPYVTCCGGTKLVLNPDGTRSSEIVWGGPQAQGATGGGISNLFPGRSVPDLAGNADPATGYTVKVDFLNMAIGGTSAVSPLYASLHAILQSYFPDKKLGNLNGVFKTLRAPSQVFDVTEGTNGAFSAKPGVDQCTGIGCIKADKVLELLKTLYT